MPDNCLSKRLRFDLVVQITIVPVLLFLAGDIIGQTLRIKPVYDARTFLNVSGNADDTIEASAVVPIADGKYLLVADDKDDGMGRSLLIVERISGKILRRLDNFQNGQRNPKWEGLAKLGNEFYIIGSHGADRGEPTEKLMARSRLFRFSIANEKSNDPALFAIERSSLQEFEIVSALTKEGLFDRNAPENLKIEGLGVRRQNGQPELMIGLRAPYQAITANQITTNFTIVYSAKVPVASKRKPTIRLDLKPLMIFDAGKTTIAPHFPYHLSSLEHDAELGGTFIMTSSERTSDNAFFGNAVWFVSDSEIATAMPNGFADRYRPVRASRLFEFEPTQKAEGIAILPGSTNERIRLIIVFDNDASSFRDRTSHMSKLQEFEVLMPE